MALPNLAVPIYILFIQRLPAGSFWATCLTQLIILGLYLSYFLVAVPVKGRLWKETGMKLPPPLPRPRSVEDRLDDLERLKRREMVTSEEYDAKRQEILKDL
jgi:hypothetical protein